MEATLSGNEIVSGVVVRVVTMRTFEGADACARNQGIRAFARGNISGFYRKSLDTSFAFD
jgi:hypothetical protein